MPRLVEFFNNAWKSIGTKADKFDLIGEVTNIPETALLDSDCLWEFEVAEKMTWASGRKATRKEDIAYSLMGLFDVNIPLLYGEGDKAFTRLQEEITRNANSTTFLQWGVGISTHRLFADDPSMFEWDIEVGGGNATFVPFSWTNVGLRLKTTLFRYGVELYGIVLSHQSSYVDVVMILRKQPWYENLFYKVCIVPLAHANNKCMSPEVTFTIMRGTRDQRIGKDDPRHEDYDFLEGQYGVEFRCNGNIAIEPHTLKCSSQTNPMQLS